VGTLLLVVVAAVVVVVVVERTSGRTRFGPARGASGAEEGASGASSVAWWCPSRWLAAATAVAWCLGSCFADPARIPPPAERAAEG
jgi:hypothetical protein